MKDILFLEIILFILSVDTSNIQGIPFEEAHPVVIRVSRKPLLLVQNCIFLYLSRRVAHCVKNSSIRILVLQDHSILFIAIQTYM